MKLEIEPEREKVRTAHPYIGEARALAARLRQPGVIVPATEGEMGTAKKLGLGLLWRRRRSIDVLALVSLPHYAG